MTSHISKLARSPKKTSCVPPVALQLHPPSFELRLLFCRRCSDTVCPLPQLTFVVSVWIHSAGQFDFQARTARVAHFPQQDESGPGSASHSAEASATIDLTDPVGETSTACDGSATRQKRKHATYSDKVCADIRHYACKNGNEKARHKFLGQYPNLGESTVRQFKKLYLNQLKVQRHREHPKPISSLSVRPRAGLQF